MGYTLISNGSLDSYTELKVRKIVQKVFRQVLESGGLSDKEIAELLDKNGSNRIFGIVHRGRFCVCVGASVCLPGAETTCHRSTRMRKIDFCSSRPDKMTKLCAWQKAVNRRSFVILSHVFFYFSLIVQPIG